ncbi:PA3496 family putative envelope integrity protein [Pseudomonas entomophila]|uniref:PA3496 family putative envelope integrity protein n=1 Tax=Pseudomonas entomophila TaxID=312306 RepID=UPI003EBB7190
MGNEKEDLVLDDDFSASTEDDAEQPAVNLKADLSKRRTIDNLLEERRLKRQLAEYDYDL